MEKETQYNIWYVIVAILGILVLQSLWSAARQVQPLPYSEFLDQLEAGNVEEVAISDTHIQGTLKSPLADGRTQFVTTRVEPELADELERYGVRFAGRIESTFLADLLSWLLPMLLFFGVWLLLFRKVGDNQGLGGFMTVGKSKAKIYMEKDTKVTFDDVAGVDEANLKALAPPRPEGDAAA